MPSRTRTPDLPAVSGQVTPPVTTEPAGPPEAAGPPEPAGPPEAAHARAASEADDGRTGATGAADSGAARDGAGGGGASGEPAWAGLRLVEVPAGWPPYDCETHGAACSAAAPDAGRQPARPAAGGEPTVAGSAVPASAGTTPGTETAEAEAEPGRAAAAGNVPSQNGEAGHAPGLSAAWPRQFAQVLVEILAGFRPAKQLAPWATERVRAQIDLLSCAADAEQRPRIRRVMTSRPTAGVVEMTMVAGFGSRSRALAVRFEHVPARPSGPGRPARPARWLCTEIETS